MFNRNWVVSLSGIYSTGPIKKMAFRAKIFFRIIPVFLRIKNGFFRPDLMQFVERISNLIVQWIFNFLKDHMQGFWKKIP